MATNHIIHNPLTYTCQNGEPYDFDRFITGEQAATAVPVVAIAV